MAKCLIEALGTQGCDRTRNSPKYFDVSLFTTMNSNHFITSAQERMSQQRFLALCLEAIRQTGQCSYPPLLRLI
jgi:hypothetical protein